MLGPWAVTPFAFDSGPHRALGIGRVAIKAPGDDIGRLLLSERRFDIGRRCGVVAHGEARAVARGIPGNAVLEIPAVDRPDRSDPAYPGPEGPFQRCRSAPAAALHHHLNGAGRRRVGELQPALLLNGVAQEPGRNGALQNGRERPGVRALGLPGELRGVALTALCRPREIAGA